jgi:hypothetical protein
VKKVELCALILLEGETEEEFYKAIADRYLRGVPKSFKLLRGNFNVNNKVIDKIIQFSTDHPGQKFDVYVCLDQERDSTPVFNESLVRSEVAGIANCLELNEVLVGRMIESIFFIDIEGIYSFLRTPKAQRKPKRYQNFRKLTHRDLTKLFNQNKKIYHKGHRCRSLVMGLDLDKIVGSAGELQYFIETVKARDKDNN